MFRLLAVEPREKVAERLQAALDDDDDVLVRFAGAREFYAWPGHCPSSACAGCSALWIGAGENGNAAPMEVLGQCLRYRCLPRKIIVEKHWGWRTPLYTLAITKLLRTLATVTSVRVVTSVEQRTSKELAALIRKDEKR